MKFLILFCCLFTFGFSFARGAGVDYYHWKDLELPHADKDRLFINYQMLKDYHINFPVMRLYNNREMKGEPIFEFTARGTLEKGELKCDLKDFDCQHGPIYKRPWGHRDGAFFAVYFPIEKQIDDTTFEIKHGGLSYFLSISSLKDYKLVIVNFEDREYQTSKFYWVQKSHQYIVQKFKEKMPNFEEEKSKMINCLRSADIKCTKKYGLSDSLIQLKEMLLENSDPTNTIYHTPVSQFNYSPGNVEVRSVLAACLEQGKVLEGVSFQQNNDRSFYSLDIYSKERIKMGDELNFEFVCRFTYIKEKSNKPSFVSIDMLHFSEI